MDELSELIDKPVRRRGRPPKRSLDEGIGSSVESLNESIANSVKRRKRVCPRNDKQFDTKYFLDSVIDRMESKYKHMKNDPVIDMDNLEIVDDNDIGSIEKNVRKDFGYFAENTLEDLRQNSFRDKRLISCPLTASTSLPPSSCKSRKQYNRTASTKSRQKPISAPRQLNNADSRALQVRSLRKVASCPQPSLTEFVVASDTSDIDSESNDGNESVELDDSHPLVVYDNKILWNDNQYQKSCLKSCIEVLRTDKSNHFRNALKERALQTLGLPALPSSPSVCPIIHFNAKGEPNFEFHFLAPNSPQSHLESLTEDSDIIFMSKTIYETIRFEPNGQRKGSKRLTYSTKRRIDFDYY